MFVQSSNEQIICRRVTKTALWLNIESEMICRRRRMFASIFSLVCKLAHLWKFVIINKISDVLCVDDVSVLQSRKMPYTGKCHDIANVQKISFAFSKNIQWKMKGIESTLSIINYSVKWKPTESVNIKWACIKHLFFLYILNVKIYLLWYLGYVLWWLQIVTAKRTGKTKFLNIRS